jgi:gliding motility-associated-like protein
MIRTIIILVLCWLPPAASSWAQGEENLWFFGEGHVVDFSGGAPVVAANPPASQQGTVYPGYYSRRFGLQAGICDAAGNLRFLMHIRSNASTAQQYRHDPKIFDATGYSMPHGDINAALTSGDDNAETPLILPWPGEPDKYFVFYMINSGLLYSVVDMRLNNGLGDVDTLQKDILLRGYGTVIGAKLTAVQACDGLWVVVRSRVANEYFSFHITRQGIDLKPVVSSCGLLPSLSDYEQAEYRGGRLAASPDGKTLAAACNRGIELYDFEVCSGRLSNPRLIDTLPFLGVCFSPNNRVLYATSWEYPSRHPGRVYQYDLGQFNAAAVTASRVLVLENPRVACATPFRCTCGSCNCDTAWAYLGDLKRGPDGKIYMASNYRSCGNPLTSVSLPPLPCPPTAPMPFPMAAVVYDSCAMHVIHEPDRLGWACRPELHVLTLRPGKYGVSTTGMWFSHPVVVAPPGPDTAAGERRTVAACFTDSMSLSAGGQGRCYRWDDGTAARERVVYAPGTYTVGYFDNACRYRTDTFTVVFTAAPHLGVAGFSCPNSNDGRLEMVPAPGDTTGFRYEWYDVQGSLLRAQLSDTGDVLAGLPPGSYRVQISSYPGCDTSFPLEVLPLPQPQALFDADSIVCRGMPLLFRSRSVAPLWQWYPGDGTMYNKGDTLTYRYRDTGSYRAMLVVQNMEGCTDTAVRRVSVKDFSISLVASATVLHRQEQVMLQSDAGEPYGVTAWKPSVLFPDQQAYRQQVTADTSREYTVVAESQYGCTDSASVTVAVHPVVIIPTAFTPDGDGRNDHFRPAVSGGPVTIRAFLVFDRWGRQVWSGQGSAAAAGWDGTYGGTPAEIGVYHYLLELETVTGQTMIRKGNVTLIR